MNDLLVIFVGLAFFLASLFLIWLFCRYAIQRGLLAIPNSRSSHKQNTPRGGGIVFVFLWVLSLAVGFFLHVLTLNELLVFLPSVLFISMLGFWDDHQSLSVRKRLVAQIAAAGFIAVILGDLSKYQFLSQNFYYLGGAGVVLAILALVWSTNLFNFMDGLDGIAAIEALFVFGVGGLLFWLSGHHPIAYLSWSLVPVIAGFLVWNWPTAHVFMGDVGSYFLGFLVALFALVGQSWYQIPISIWIILYGVFWFDATLTLLRRWWRGENLTLPHLEHAFHRLHRAGYSTQQVLAGVFVINSVLAGIALTAYFHPNLLRWGLLLTIGILSLVYCVIEKIKPMMRVA